MSGPIRKAYGTESVGISARVIVMRIGSSRPGRRIVIVTGVPLGPRSFRTTSSVETSSFSSSSSTWVMMSPARMPSLKAGVPSMGAITVMRPIRFWIWIPRPKNEPCCFSRMAA